MDQYFKKINEGLSIIFCHILGQLTISFFLKKYHFPSKYNNNPLHLYFII